MEKTGKFEFLDQIREQIIGINAEIDTPFGKKPLVYADWTASGRMFAPIEKRLNEQVYPLVANTHSETNYTGTNMTRLYHEAIRTIKKHVNASEKDVLISDGTGMTGAINKFQRILGIKLSEEFTSQISLSEEDKPIVFVTHMEHHSNHISWTETIADVRIIQPDKNGLPDLEHLKELLTQFSGRKRKFASVTAASNVTGVLVDVHQIAAIMHEHNGFCFADYACAGPYVNIDMHPENFECALDAVFLSPHKFLGGPSTSGILVFNQELYHHAIPDNPGGGTVVYTSPFNRPKYISSIEEREDGGTPGFIQAMRTALSIRLKEQITTDLIQFREHEQIAYFLPALSAIPGVTVLEASNANRLTVFSVMVDGLYHHLGVKMLNDRYGIQVRGGCSCAGTYGHFLLGIDEMTSCKITALVDQGEILSKPGWMRISLHPTTTQSEMEFIIQALTETAKNHVEWSKEYSIDPKTGTIRHQHEVDIPLTLFSDFVLDV